MDKALQINVCGKLMDLYCLFTGYWNMSKGKSLLRISSKYDAYNIMMHLNGEYAVCVYAGEHATKFMTIDVDLNDPAVVHKVIDTMVDMGIPRELIYVSFSGRKGYHVDIFFRNYVYNEYTYKFYWAMIERSGLDPRKVEFRPTKKMCIKIPLGVHQETGKRCWFVDRETLEPIEDFSYIFEVHKIDMNYFTDLVKNLVNEHMRSIYNEIAVENEKKKSQPKVKSDYNSLVVTAPGTRHNLQKKVAARARMDGMDYDGVVQAQMDWYNSQDKSKIMTPEDEVRVDAEELAAWAVKNVTIKHVKKESKEFRRDPTIRITKQMISYILRAPKKSGQLVLFLLAIFCGKYGGEAKISIKTIAEYVGVSDRVVSDNIHKIVNDGLVEKERTFSKYDKLATVRGANIYRFPGTKKIYAPEKKYLNAEYYDIHEWITKDNIHDVYLDTLVAICKPEYLAKYLTKPELRECERRIADDTEGAGVES